VTRDAAIILEIMVCVLLRRFGATMLEPNGHVHETFGQHSPDRNRSRAIAEASRSVWRAQVVRGGLTPIEEFVTDL